MAGTNGGYNPAGPRFTDDDRKDWGARHDRGESVPSIAKRYRCSANTIYHYLKTTRRYPPQPAGLPGGVCVRCGIDLGRPGMCLDCLETEGLIAS